MGAFTLPWFDNLVGPLAAPTTRREPLISTHRDDSLGYAPTGSSAQATTVEIVALDDILIHEVHDPTRAEPLAQAIRKDGIQRNPVILARTQNSPLVHLDGANRLTALRQLGCPHVAAQVLDYADPHAVTLDIWLHLVPTTENELLTAAESWAGTHLRSHSPQAAIAALNQPGTSAAIIFASGSAYTLVSGAELTDRVVAMARLTALYSNQTEREILPPGDVLTGVRTVLKQHPRAQACVVFAPVSKTDVITLAWKLGRQLPAGITRYQIRCGRVLSVNVPLELLQADLSPSKKTLQLQGLLATRRRRHYSEPTVVYEEY